MTWRILVVEDELLERQSLVRFLEQSRHAVDVRCVSTAEEFYQEAKSFQPAMVFLDIRIPLGDGLATLRLLREEGFTGEVAVVSAYDVFEYARSSLDLGVSFFHVKPVSRREILETLDRLVALCLERERAEGEAEWIRRMVEAHRGAIARNILQNYLVGDMLEEDFVLAAPSVGLPPSKACYLFGVIALPGAEVSRGFEDLVLQKALEGTLEGDTVVVPWKRFSAFLFCPADERATVEELAARILQALAASRSVGNVLVAGRVETMRELRGMVERLEESLEESLLGGSGRFIFLEDIPASPEEEQEVSEEPALQAGQELVLEALRDGRADLLERGLQMLLPGGVSGNTADGEWKRVWFKGLLGRTGQLLLGLRCESVSVKGWSRKHFIRFLAAESPLDLGSMVREALQQAYEIRVRAKDRDLRILQGALGFIQEHYDTVTLENTAAVAGVSVFQLSRLFHRKLGRRFVDYVKAYRMEKAKALLLEGQAVGQVAVTVGYDNISYFSTAFKKHVGCPPREYVHMNHEA